MRTAPDYTLHSIPGGRSGTVRTLREMQKLVRESASNPVVIETAHNVVRRVPERDDVATMGAMLDEVRRRMRYTRDPLGVELVKAPWVVIERTGGSAGFSGLPEPMDCDDATTLLAGLLGAVGIPTRFRVVGTDHGRPKEFSHVYLAGRTSKGEWLALDPIVRGKGVGWEVPTDELAAPRGNFGVNGFAGLGWYDGPRRARCRMDDNNRLNGGGFGGIGGTAGSSNGLGISTSDVTKHLEKAVLKVLKDKYGLVPADKSGNVAPPAAPGKAKGGTTSSQWFSPMVDGRVNWKAVAVWGGIGFAAWKFSKGRR